MSNDSSVTKLLLELPVLDQETFESWAWSTRNALIVGGVWQPIMQPDSSGTRPVRPTPASSVQGPTTAEASAMAAYDAAATKAASWILQAAGIGHRDLTEAKLNPPDAPGMWDAIFLRYARQDAGSRFHALHKLLNAHKTEEENWETFIQRINTDCHALQRLIPAGWTVLDLFNELKMFVLLNELPKDHSLRATLLVDPNLSFTTVTNGIRRYVASNTSLLTSEVASAAQNSTIQCFFCRNHGHKIADCRTMSKYQEQYFKDRDAHFAGGRGTSSNTNRGGRGGHGGGRGGWRGSRGGGRQEHAHVAESGEATNTPELIEEYAGNASSLTSYSSTDANCWTADSGASIHMTFRREWLTRFSPERRRIKLADGSVIHSAGIGSVKFVPFLNGVEQPAILINSVLYVPELRTNLLSLLFLTRSKQYSVHFWGNQITFKRKEGVLMTASVNNHNTAYLDGRTESHETALSINTVTPVTSRRLHERLAHRHYALIERMRTSDIVKDLKVVDKGSPNEICEPCIDGKMHRAPHTVPAEPAKEPLALVFTDLKGPLDTQSRQGYKYWVSFTDSFSRMVAVYFLRTKGDVFGAFKQYRAWAENQMNKRAVKFDEEDLRRTVKTLRDDKGGEYTSKALEEFCGEYGIEREHTIRDTPQQNGVSEHFNRTMAEGITAMLAHAKLPAFMWADAGAAFVHIHNRCPSSAIGFKTPYELWNGEKPSVAHLRVWGCLAFIHLQKDQRRQLSPHAKRCIFIGYPPDYKGWIFWDPERSSVVVSDSAVFAEEKFPGKIRGRIETDLLDDAPTPEPSSSSPPNVPDPPAPPTPPAAPVSSTPNPTDPNPPNPPSPVLPNFDPSPSRSATPVLLRIPAGIRQSPNRTPRLSREARNLTKWFEKHPHNDSNQQGTGPSSETHTHPDEPDEPPDSDGEPEIADFAFGVDIDDLAEFVAYSGTQMESVEEVGSKESAPPANDETSTPNSTHLHYIGLNDVVDYAFFSSPELEPNSLAEAARRPDADKFIGAAIDEIKAHLDNGTWEVVQLPPGKKAIGCRWVFKIKRNADGSIERYKGRIVAKGYAQRQGVDYTDTFAPTARFGALRTVIALAAVEDMELESVDISTAFLNGDIDADVYMQVPEGIEIEGEEKGRWVLKLLKALYGIKQGPRLWSKKLNQALEKMGFKRLDCDHSVFIYEKGSVKIIVPVHVDDLVIASKSRTAITNFKKELSTHFKIRDQGPTSFLLGIKLERDRPNRTITLSQPAYIQDLLDTYVNAKIFNPVLTPMLDGKLSEKDCPKTKEEIEAMKKIPYREAVGKLLYLAIATRPDIAYAVGVLCRFNANPGGKHWAAVKHLLRYLRGTQNMKLVYSPDSSTERFTTHCDADLGGNPDNSRSTAGYVMKVGSGAVMWGSKLQKHVSLSSTESEYTTASAAAREMMWMRFFLEEIGHDMSAPSTLFMDSGSAIQVAQNPEHQSTMKHVHRSYNWIREKVESKELRVAHVPGDENVADIFTKPLQKNKFLLFRDMLGLRQ